MHQLNSMLWVVGLALFACSSSEARPTQVARDAPRGEILVVTHPPPAALPEVVPSQPNRRSRWVSGYWVFEGNDWVWLRGGWVEAQSNTWLVPSRFAYGAGGVLEFSDRRWIDANGEEVAAPKVISPAEQPPVPALSEDATLP